MDETVSRYTLAGGLATTAARWACLFLLVNGIVRLWLQGEAWPLRPEGVAAALAMGVACLLLTSPDPRPLERREVVLLMALALFATVMILELAPGVGQIPAFNAAMHLVALLLPRGNPRAGLLGSSLVLGYGFAWALPHGSGLLPMIEMMSIPVGTVVACVVWRHVLRLITGRQVASRDAASIALERAAAATEAAEASRAEFRDIREAARAPLAAIAAGAPLEASLRAQLQQTEAAIRDRIRAPQLQHQALVAEIASLRRRGVTVVLLGEPASGSETIGDTLAHGVADAIRAVRSGRVTIRSLPPGREVSLSVVISEGDAAQQLRFASDGRQLALH